MYVLNLKNNSSNLSKKDIKPIRKHEREKQLLNYSTFYGLRKDRNGVKRLSMDSEVKYYLKVTRILRSSYRKSETEIPLWDRLDGFGCGQFCPRSMLNVCVCMQIRSGIFYGKIIAAVNINRSDEEENKRNLTQFLNVLVNWRRYIL